MVVEARRRCEKHRAALLFTETVAGTMLIDYCCDT
jgi:hypothetical protein